MRYSIIILFLSSVVLISCANVKECNPVDDATPIDLSERIPEIPYLGNFKIPEDNPMTEEGVLLGRMLFYEEMLSGDNTMSCGSCHIQDFAFSDGKAVSKGIDGITGKRSSMALVNLLWDRKFFWDGRASSLEEQALMPIQDEIELHQSLEDAVAKLQASEVYPRQFKKAFGDVTITPERIGKALAQFERTLLSTDSKFDKWNRGEVELTLSEYRGFRLMVHPDPGSGLEGGNCSDCHKFNNFVDPEAEMRNNGLDVTVVDKGLEAITGDTNDRGKMKIPTLRNIAVSAPYMHDGRFNTLEEVLDHYNSSTVFGHENVDGLIKSAYNNPLDPTQLSLTDEQKADIIAFLHTLTDQTYLTNPEFSDPDK